MKFDEKVLRDIIQRAVEEGKLFELIFTENGKRLWASWSEEKFKKMVLNVVK